MEIYEDLEENKALFNNILRLCKSTEAFLISTKGIKNLNSLYCKIVEELQSLMNEYLYETKTTYKLKFDYEDNVLSLDFVFEYMIYTFPKASEFLENSNGYLEDSVDNFLKNY